jgi:hypothetical protein
MRILENGTELGTVRKQAQSEDFAVSARVSAIPFGV